MMNSLKVPEKITNERVDAVLSLSINDLSRTSLKNRIEFVSVNGQKCKLSRKVNEGDLIEFSLKKEESIKIIPEDISLDIIYEDNNVFVINKPAGMVVHPAEGNYTGTLSQGLMFRLQAIGSDFAADDPRPGIVHRLDKDTSGIIIAAKNIESLNFLSEQFKNRKASKTYLAIINGLLPAKKGTIESLISRDKLNRKKMTWQTEHGKAAITRYKVLKSWKDKSFVSLSPKTGRTHQLRVHMLKMRTSITGDPVYARKTDGYQMMLHAYKLRINLPGEDIMREFRAPLPDRFKSAIVKIANKD